MPTPQELRAAVRTAMALEAQVGAQPEPVDEAKVAQLASEIRDRYVPYLYKLFADLDKTFKGLNQRAQIMYRAMGNPSNVSNAERHRGPWGLVEAIASRSTEYHELGEVRSEISIIEEASELLKKNGMKARNPYL